MRYTYSADRERSQHYEKKKNHDTEHDKQQGQAGVKKICVHIQEIQIQAQTVFCTPRMFLRGDV